MFYFLVNIKIFKNCYTHNLRNSQNIYMNAKEGIKKIVEKMKIL